MTDTSICKLKTVKQSWPCCTGANCTGLLVVVHTWGNKSGRRSRSFLWVNSKTTPQPLAPRSNFCHMKSWQVDLMLIHFPADFGKNGSKKEMVSSGVQIRLKGYRPRMTGYLKDMYIQYMICICVSVKLLCKLFPARKMLGGLNDSCW